MPANPPTPNPVHALSFCREYVRLAGHLAGLTQYFMIAALVLGVACGVVELIRKYRQPPASARAAAGALQDLINALKAFLEALGNSPAWLGLFGIGLLLFWAVGAAVPSECNNILDEPYTNAQ